MGVLDRAYETKAIALSYGSGETQIVGLLGGTDDPSSVGVDATDGSMYFRTSGQIWQKTGPLDTDWTEKGSGAGAAPNSFDGVILTAINYTAANKVLIGVDTTNNAVQIDLPDANSFLERVFFIKWVKGLSANKVTIVTQAGQTADDYTSIQLNRIKDSIEVIAATPVEWWLV